MKAKYLHYDSHLVRTEIGTTKMRARSSADISPKLRSVLFLIDGNHSFGELLERAGSLRDLLESQILELIERQLVEIRDPDGAGRTPEVDSATTPVSPGYKAKAHDLPPVVAAKMQLLLRLESTRSDEIDLLGAELLEAKNLRDLAHTAKSVTNRLAMSVGIERSQQFWKDAKEILTAWRDISAKSELADGE